MLEIEAADHEFVEKPPEFWKRTSPVVLARLIERARTRIEFHLGVNHEFVRALARVKRAIPAARWRRILEKLEPGVWISVIGGPDWDPRILSNGGVGNGAWIGFGRRDGVLKRNAKGRYDNEFYEYYASDLSI